ncbi:hypothetical protein [Clostridium sp. D53t1_180928_C8]|uniref:hypothetical protein n=1 Tax=Clostridium sp. D53t1_180928_C8 TaxID=2787101 RepID=UPI0018AB2F44|nr:hypothetical protein [Clostridium sp. D53t1_180928_C8]
MNNRKSQKDNNWRIVTSTFSAIVSILIIISIVVSMGNKLIIKDEKIKIIGMSSMTIYRYEVLEIELLDDMPKSIKKLKGGLECYIGLYKLDNGEDAYVYKENLEGPFIKISCKDKKIYMSFSKDETIKTYNKLIEFIVNKS